MDALYNCIKKIKIQSSHPIILASLALIFVYTISMLSGEKDLSAVGTVVFNVSVCSFFVFSISHNSKKTVASGVAMLSAEMLLYALCGAHFALIFGLFFAVIFGLICKKISYLNAVLLMLFVASFFAFLTSLFYKNLFEIQTQIASFLGAKPVLFGAFNNALKLFVGDTVEGLIYHKSFSSTAVINDRVISGVVDIFKASTNSPKPAVSGYLTGKYFACVFIPLGVFGALYKRLDGQALFAFISSVFLSVLFGDERLFYLALLITSPLLYIGSLGLIVVGYIVSALLDLRIGFVTNSSVFELIKYINKPIVLLLTAAVMVLLSFFVTKLIMERFSLLVIDNFPKSVRTLIEALGGKRNILKVNEQGIIVANPNLIDILRLDCDIRENNVLLIPEDMELIRKYCE